SCMALSALPAKAQVVWRICGQQSEWLAAKVTQSAVDRLTVFDLSRTSGTPSARIAGQWGRRPHIGIGLYLGPLDATCSSSALSCESDSAVCFWFTSPKAASKKTQKSIKRSIESANRRI